MMSEEEAELEEEEADDDESSDMEDIRNKFEHNIEDIF